MSKPLRFYEHPIAGLIPVDDEGWQAFWSEVERVTYKRQWVRWLNARIRLRRLRTGKDVIV